MSYTPDGANSRIASNIYTNGAGAITAVSLSAVLYYIIALLSGSYTATAVNNAALRALPSTAYTQITRLGYATAGDSTPVLYLPKSTCPYGSGGDDGGGCVATSDGKFWVAQFPAEGADVRVWGCKADGVVDQGACITTAAANYSGCIVIPPSPLGFYVATTAVVNSCVTGTAWNPKNPSSTTPSFSGSSWLKCNTGATACLQVGTSNSLSMAPMVENLILAGQGAPTAGGMGFQAVGGYNTNTRNLYAYNFDTCYKYGPGSTSAPISVNNFNTDLGLCKSHFVVVDGSPEIKFIGGRWGANGTGDYGATQDFLYQTLTATVGGGGGPNTVTVANVQMNPGSGGGVACAFRWGGYTGSGGIQTETRLTDDHVEFHTYSGGLTQGIFCSDSTVPKIAQLFVKGMLTATGGLTVPLFSLDAATYPSQWHFTDNIFGCSGITLNTGLPPSTSASEINFSHNQGCSSASFTAGNTNAMMWSSDNAWNTLTLSGQWANLAINGDNFAAGLTDTATGNVEMAQVFPQTWTPVLQFGGATTGITYSARGGSISRTAYGGFTGYATVILTSKGSATGSATLSGLPYTCGSGYSGGVINQSGFTGLTGALSAWVSGANLSMAQTNATGQTALTDAAFTNSTTFTVQFSCMRTL